jgi:flagellar hook assembly protein FlgD
MSHTMKLWKRVIEHRLRGGVTNVTENQSGLASFLSLCIHQVKSQDPRSFFTTPKR